MTFANPLFLWGLLGLAAPVLIHLINRDLFRPLLFPSLRFILRGKLPVERKRRLRDLLLLALRMLLFAAIVSALARPQWQPAAAAPPPGEEESELVILIDGSASMSGWDAWREAVAQAEKLLEGHGQATAGLVLSGAGPLAVEPLTTNHRSLLDLLNRSAPEPVAGDHREGFRQALRLFQNKAPRTLAVISDFQQSDWALASLPQADASLQINWIQINRGARENAAILHARALPLPDGRRQVVAEIKNFGQLEVDRTVQLRAGDELLSRSIQLAPGETESLTFTLAETAASGAELTIDADAFPADDRYFLWLARPPAIRVLAVAPTTEEPEKAEELYFLTRALSTRSETQWLHFMVNPVEPGALTEDALSNVQAVFILGAAPYLSSAEWALLHNHLQQGGRLLFTPGKAPARQSTLLADQGMIDLSFEGVAAITHREPRPHHIDWVQPDSPLDLLFRDEAARALSQVSIYQYVRFQAPSEPAHVLLRAANGDPLLLQREIGPGLLLATAFPFQTSWTDLPVSTAFLPIIRELVAGDLPPDHGIINVDTSPNKTAIGSRLNLPADDAAFASLDPLAPGIHVFGNTPVVLNVPRSESLPGTTNPVDLEAAVSPLTGAANITPAGSDQSRIISLWPWFAMAALIFFIIEMPLAAHLRRIRQAEPAVRPAVPANATSQPS